MRENKERERIKGSQIFSICVSSRQSQCNYAAAERETSFVHQRVICIEMKKITIFSILCTRLKTNTKSKTKDKREKHVMKL